MAIEKNVKFGKRVKVFQPKLVNLYGCKIGEETKIGAFVEIQKGAVVGRKCKISSHSFICEGVTIEDEVFIGHGVKFINDKYPRATNKAGSLQNPSDWKKSGFRTLVKKRAAIGSNATILSGVTIGENALVGAGAVVTRDVPPETVVTGVPAKILRKVEENTDVIPLVNLKRQYLFIKDEVDSAVSRIFAEGSFVLGKDVSDFEEAFAKFTGSKYCVGVGSGRDALLLSMRALGVGYGDEVITVANTFIATVFPIIELGAKPVFIDIDPATYQMDVKKLEKAINKKTKAIVPVHLFGIPNDMAKIMKVARKHKLLVIEDACQAHGVRFKGKHMGTFGDTGAFSFYPGKNLGAPGEGGTVITNKKSLYEKIKIMRDVGQSKKYYHTLFGYNSRLDTLHAAVLLVKLKRLEEWNEKRRNIALLYGKLLSDLPIALPPVMTNGNLFNYHLFVIRTKKRDKLLEFLKKNEVFCGIHYPVPVHLQKALKDLRYKKGSFPITEKYAKEILSLPIFPEMKNEEVEKVSALIHRFFQK